MTSACGGYVRDGGPERPDPGGPPDTDDPAPRRPDPARPLAPVRGAVQPDRAPVDPAGAAVAVPVAAAALLDPQQRQPVKQLEYNLLCRWFVRLALEAAAGYATTFTTNRQCLLGGTIAAQFLAQTVALGDEAHSLAREHFSMDGTVLDAWASQKIVRPVEDDLEGPVDPTNTGVSFHGQRRTNQTHRSVTDFEVRFARKSVKTGRCSRIRPVRWSITSMA